MTLNTLFDANILKKIVSPALIAIVSSNLYVQLSTGRPHLDIWKASQTQHSQSRTLDSSAPSAIFVSCFYFSHLNNYPQSSAQYKNVVIILD